MPYVACFVMVLLLVDIPPALAGTEKTADIITVKPDLILSPDSTVDMQSVDKNRAQANIGKNRNRPWAHGGIMPRDSASITVFSQSLPKIPLRGFIQDEISSPGTEKVEWQPPLYISDTECLRISIAYDAGLEEPMRETSVYCAFRQNLYKFILDYYGNDPQEEAYLAAFSHVLDTATFENH